MSVDSDIAALQAALFNLQTRISVLEDKQKWLILYKNTTINELAKHDTMIDSMDKMLNSPMELTKFDDKLVIRPSGQGSGND